MYTILVSLNKNKDVKLFKTTLKRHLSILFILVIISCKDVHKQSPDKVVLDPRNKKILNNDTLCAENTGSYHFKEISLLKACHVILNDSISEEINRLYGSGKLSTIFNFDQESKEVNYQITGDTLTLRRYYLVRSPITRVLPDSMFLKGDSLFIKEKGVPCKSDLRLDRFLFEEIHYTFLLNGINSSIKIFMLD